MEPGMKYLVAVATEVSKTKEDSQLWHINGRWVNIVNPADVRTLQDGRIMVSWPIDENAGYELTGETVFGLTSTNAQGRSVISYVGFSANLSRTAQELNQTVGIADLPLSPEPPTAIYAPDGTPRRQLSHGVNIIRQGDRTAKVFKK